MPNRKWPFVLLALCLVITLVGGLFYFAGIVKPDSYPAMSSLNTGPDGAKLLFDTLHSIPSLQVKRNFQPFTRWRPTRSTILLLSTNPLMLNNAESDDLVELEHLAQAHNRVVLCLTKEAELEKPDPKKPLPLKTRWGLQILSIRDNDKKDAASHVVLDHDSSWHVVAGLSGAFEKRLPSGGFIVVSLNSDNLSNERLAKEASALIEVPPLIGQNSAIIFDEVHLGIEDSGSIAALAVHFKLQGLIVGLLLLLALFIWNQSVSFPPPSEAVRKQDTQVTGVDARATFAGLIARHLSPQSLMESCVAEWNRMKPEQRIQSGIPAKVDPVTTYRELQENVPKKRNRI